EGWSARSCPLHRTGGSGPTSRRSRRLRRPLALQPKHFRLQLTDAVVRLPGALLAGGNDLAPGVAPAQPGLLDPLEPALPQAQPQADVRPRAGLAEAIGPAHQLVGAQHVPGENAPRVEDGVVADAEPGVEGLLERLLAALRVGNDLDDDL